MIDLYYWTTPNGHKITIFLEEARSSWRSRPTIASRRLLTTTEGMAASQSRYSNLAPSYFIWPRKPESLFAATFAARSRSSSGCSGKWAGSVP